MTRQDAADLAARLKVIASGERLQMLAIIAAEPDLCAADVHARLGRLGQPTISYHLSILAAAGLVTCGAERSPSRQVPLELNPAVLHDLADAVRALAGKPRRR